jgi:hypothetical protein
MKRGLSGACFHGCAMSPEIVIYDEIPNLEMLGFILLAHIDLGDCGKRKDEIE